MTLNHILTAVLAAPAILGILIVLFAQNRSEMSDKSNL